MTLGGFEITIPVIVLGSVTGMTYGILAVGLVLVYRSNRIINFAHGEIGAFAAALLLIAVQKWHFPYWVAFVAALLAAAVVGGVSEAVVVRRLRKAPPLMSIVATLGLGQFLLLFSLVLNSQASAGQLYPKPVGLPEFDVGPLRVNQAYAGMLFLTPVLVLAIFLFLRNSRFGLAIRASADNPEAARMAGVSASAMSSLSWMIAGAVSAFTVILVLPTRGFANAQFLGPGLLLRALAAAVVARMVSLPVALAAGLGVGIIEQVLLWNYPRGGLVEAVLFVMILVVLLVQPRQGVREDGKGSWTAVQPWPPLPEAFLRVWSIRNLGRIVAVVAGVLGLALPLLSSNLTAVSFSTIAAFAIVGLSIGIVSGLGGQLSLGQFALAGVGAAASIEMTARTGSFIVGFVSAGLVAAAVSLVIGLPALRIRGLMLVVTTLGFALAAQGWLFQQPWVFGDGVSPERPKFSGVTLGTARQYYVLSFCALLASLWLARNAWRGGIGRRLRATRDNESAARAFSVPVTIVKLQGFVVAGVLAGIGGAVYGHSLSRLGATAFPTAANIDIAAMAVLGGIGILAGPLIGAMYIIGVPRFLPLDNAGLAATSLGWLLLVLYFPGGVAQMIRPVRERVVDVLARRRGLDPVAIREDRTEPVARPTSVASALPRPDGVEGTTVLRLDGLTRRYGGVVAIEDVCLEVNGGETLGVIGPNGAGKTTLFEVVGGFTRQDAGSVVFAGTDVSRMSADERANLGLIRSFQDASLFPTLTVLDCIKVALERADPTRFLAELAGSTIAERRKDARARELAAMMGLYAYRSKRVSDLSTGTRRIAELACLLALEPVVLLLDEPSSGIAQRETEELGNLLAGLKTHLRGLTLVIIEHDIPLITRLADRLVAMESGRILLVGEPDVVRSEPRVVSSYLGVDSVTIERSDAVAPTNGASRVGAAR